MTAILNTISEAANATRDTWESARERAADFVERPSAAGAGRGFVAGAAGAGIAAGLMYALHAAGAAPRPAFVRASRRLLGRHGVLIDHAAGLAGYALAGGIWGSGFGAVVREPSVAKGMAYGLAPTAFNGAVIDPLIGNRPFAADRPKQAAINALLGVAVWGCFVGWFCGPPRRGR